MEIKQKQFLKNKLKEFAKTQPDILKLRRLLLSIGGEEICAPQQIDHDIPFMINNGFIMDLPITMTIMQEHGCHINTARLVATKKNMSFATGFVNFGRGLWSQHSWAIYREKDGTNSIIETTCKGIRYFGVVFSGMWGLMKATGEYECNGVTLPANLEQFRRPEAA